jgi:hypothetical protein
VKIIDGINYIRRVFEKDVSGRAPRNIINDMLTHRGEPVIWVWDSPGAKATRQNILPCYKSKRLPAPENIWPIINLIKEALQHTPALQVEVPRFEADDVIATLVRKFPNEKKFIVSNDADLRQLLVVPNTEIEAKEPTFAVAPQHIRLFKTFVGDPSDNIGGVVGFGKKTWTDVDKTALADNLNAYLAGGIAHWDELGIPTRSVNWIKNNQQALSDVWTVVGLWDVPHDMINRHTIVGQRDPLKVQQLLEPFYL